VEVIKLAFGDIYGYKTKTRSVVAIAEGAEYQVGGVDVVDVVLVGVANGRRTAVRVAASEGAATTNQVWAA
jgi:hypothetical protein